MPDAGAGPWTEVCALADLGPGTATTVPGACPPVAVFNVDGELFAVDDTCTHAEYSLSQGYLDGDAVECELHFATFSVRTGAALTAPAQEPLGTYPVEVEAGRVFVAVTRRCVLAKLRT
ncbi:(2Fe-2S)-binding protein [Pseudonocardia sp. CNS-139]|nr:(2Fe-2S)-binding protein [Pseudonocardia sp. CNS-139]